MREHHEEIVVANSTKKPRRSNWSRGVVVLVEANEPIAGAPLAGKQQGQQEQVHGHRSLIPR